MSDFENIQKKIAVPLQEQSEQGVAPKKAGRPPRPNMERVVVRLDKSMHADIRKFALQAGVTKSSVVSMAIKNFLSKSEKRYKLVEA